MFYPRVYIPRWRNWGSPRSSAAGPREDWLQRPNLVPVPRCHRSNKGWTTRVQGTGPSGDRATNSEPEADLWTPQAGPFLCKEPGSSWQHSVPQMETKQGTESAQVAASTRAAATGTQDPRPEVRSEGGGEARDGGSPPQLPFTSPAAIHA